MDAAAEPDIATYMPVSVTVKNRGHAVVSIKSDVDKGFAVIPNIETISPAAGSKAGGALLTITGSGFVAEPYVDVGGFPCDVQEYSYGEVTCLTPAASRQGEKDVTVTVPVNGNLIPANCETSTNDCVYMYATLWTPTLSAVTPTTLGAGTTLTITGTKFGNSTLDITVLVGGESATIDSVTDTEIVATFTNVPVGSNDLIVRVSTYGQPEGASTVTGEATVDTVTPATGSIYGQTTITVAGNGFIEGDTTILVDGSACEVESVTLAEVVCVTPSKGSAGTVDIAVTSGGMSYPTISYEYSTGATPTITAVTPTSALAGTTLTITGTNLGGANPNVTLGGADCFVDSSTSTSIICIAGNHATGAVPVTVFIDGMGMSNDDVEFEYELSLDSIAPTSGKIAFVLCF